MTVVKNNPFAQWGKVLGKGHLIGREYALHEIENRVMIAGGRLAIIGLPRIGVSSLINTAIIERKQELHQQALLPIEITLSHDQYSSHEPFFRELVRRCKYELERLKWLTESTKSAALEVLQGEDSFLAIQNFFEAIYRDGIHVIFIFHAFDYAGIIFNESVPFFQRLKTLAEHPEYRITIITLSCLPLDQIAQKAMAISRFDQIFHIYYVGGFDEKDMEEYMALLTASLTPPDACIDNALKAKLEERLDFYCGRHPYLLTKLGYELVEAFHKGNGLLQDVDNVAKLYSVRKVFRSYVHYLVEILRRFPTYRILSKLQQVVIGPVVDIGEDDIETLKAYDLIKVNRDTTPNEYGIIAAYVAFCHDLQSYLAILDLEDDLWPLWSKTEKAMRQAIATILKNAFGEDWFSVLESGYPQISYNRNDNTTLFSRCRHAHSRTILEQLSKPATNLLDYTYPKELFDLILYMPRASNYPSKSLWHDIFQPIFSRDHRKDRAYWRTCALFLGRVRNPLAHNRDYALYKEDREKANAYCREILQILDPYISH